MTDMTQDEAIRTLKRCVFVGARQNQAVAMAIEALSRPAPALGSAEVEALCERLEAPANWMREARGDWKGAELSYDNTPKEAADLIRRQAEEIERLREGLTRSAAGLVGSVSLMKNWSRSPSKRWREQFIKDREADIEHARALLNKETGDDDA